MRQRREFLIVATLFGILFLATADNQLLIPLFPLLSRQFEVSVRSLGGLFSGYALAAALMSLLLGPLTDRLGRLPFLRLGLGFFVLLALATSAAQSYWELLWLRVGTGAAAGILSTCTASFVGDFFPYRRRGRVTGTVLSSYYAALIFGIPLSSWVAEQWNWSKVFLVSSLLASVLLAMCLLFFPWHSPRHSVESGSYFRAYLQFLQRRETRAALGVSFSVSGTTLALLTFLGGYLDHAFGVSQPLEIASLFLVVGVASILGSPLAGWLSDRWTKRGVFLTANTLLIVFLLTLDRWGWGFPLMAAFCAVGLCVAFRQTALQTVQTELVTSRERGSFLALRNGSSQVGISLSVFLAGFLYSAKGYGAVLLLAALLTLGSSLLFYLAIPEPAAQVRNKRSGTSL